MIRSNHLNYCKTCKHKKNDFNKGMVCGLTNEFPNFEISCADYKDSAILIKQEEIKQAKIKFEKKKNKKKITKRVLLTLIAINAFVIYGFYKLQIETNQQKEDFQENKTKIPKKKQPKGIEYFASAKRIAVRRNKVKKDTSFSIAKHLKIVMHKKYYMSVIEEDKLPVLSISRGYSFTYDKVKKDNSKSLTQQWIDLRKSFSTDFDYTIKEKYTVENMEIVEIDFKYLGKRNVYGVAKIIEIDGNRYFFHYSFKQQFEDYKLLRKYLNYYVKISL